MKILYFHQHFTTPSLGGGTRSYEFARKIIDRGHDVTVVCGRTAELNLPASDSNEVLRGIIDGIDVIQINLPYSNCDGIAKRIWIFLKFAWRGTRIAMNEKYDLLFATSTPLTAGIPGIWMKWFARKKRKFVFEVRDLWPELPKALGMKNPLLLWGMGLLEKLSYREADGCIGLSPGICDGIKQVVPDKTVEMIPNGCDLDIFEPGNRKDLRLEGVLPIDTVAVFTGAHGIANGLEAVLDMALELKQRGRNDIKIAFIGNGRVKPDLVKRAEKEGLDNCLFFDPVPKTVLNKIVSSADIGLMVLKNVPAFYYGTSPNKFFDYIASGLPVVNNYPGWLSDMITENKCGVVVPPDNATAFAEGLIYLADHQEERGTMGANSRILAEKQFSRDQLADKFVDFLESISQS
jgi:glycosyltransferase involved in cell wall biosynthesis